MKKYIIVFLFFLLGSVNLKAQDSQITQNLYTQLMVNPGYAGSDGKICAYALQRLQWVGFDGAPTSTLFNADMAIKKFGIGVSLENKTEGFDNNFRVNLSIAYRFPLGNGNLGVGIKWGVANSNIQSDVTWNTPDPNANETIDPAIPDPGSSALSYLDFGFGLYYNTQDLYLGISSTQLYTQMDYNDPENYTTTLKRHYFITAGYNMPFSNPLLVFKPNLFLVSDGTFTQIALNGIVEYNKKLWGGVSLRTDKAISGIVGVELFKWVKVSYSYDFVVSELTGYNNGTHEIMMGFNLDVKKDKTPEKYKSIRFL